MVPDEEMIKELVTSSYVYGLSEGSNLVGCRQCLTTSSDRVDFAIN